MSALKPIWLVEDNARDIELTLSALEECQLANRVVVLRDGGEALHCVRDLVNLGSEAHPAVILLDVKMPKVNGVEVLRTIKADPCLKSLPVVMMSSSRETPDLAECYSLGVNAYVVKPMQFNEFFEAVKVVGRFWAVVNDPPELETEKRRRDGSATGE